MSLLSAIPREQLWKLSIKIGFIYFYYNFFCLSLLAAKEQGKLECLCELTGGMLTSM